MNNDIRPAGADVITPVQTLTPVASQGPAELVPEAVDRLNEVNGKGPPKWKLPIILVVAAVLLVAGFLATMHLRSAGAARANLPVDKSVSLPLNALSAQLGATAGGGRLTVNGQLMVNGALVVVPNSRPASAQAGQLYFDTATNVLNYYNGTSFVGLQGGGNTYVTNNVGGAVTNVYNASSGTSGLAGSGTAGNLALFTGTGSLGDSVVSQSGNNLVAGSANGSSTIQGGAAGVVMLSAAANGSSGPITLESGASATSAAGNITIDTGHSIVTGTLVNIKTFEDGLDNMVDGYGYHDTLVVSTAQAHNGTHGLAVTEGNGPVGPQWDVGDNEPYSGFPVTAGHKYFFSAWIRAGGADTSVVTGQVTWSNDGYLDMATQSWGVGTDSASKWTQISGVLTAPAGASALLLNFYSNVAGAIGDVHYLDDISVTDLSSSSAVANINIGADNAQQVTVGNVNEIGATSVYGGGVNIGAGQGNINITGGALTQTTSTAAIATTAGALNITAAGSSTWEIATGGGAGGSLTIHAGNANGGDFNGGSLLLQGGEGMGAGVSGNVTADTQLGAVSGTVVDTRSFETGTDNMLAAFGASIAQTNAAALYGTYSLAVTGTGGAWQVSQDIGQPGIPVTAGDTYYFSAWMRDQAAAETVSAFITWQGAGTLKLNSITETTTDWVHVTGEGVAPAGVTSAFWNLTGSGVSGEVQYVDYLTVTNLGTSTGVSAVNVGNGYAQAVNIGNLSEVGPTNIQGGAGVDINAGASSASVSGSTVVVKPTVDSASAFEVQNATGTALMTADTAGMSVTVQALVINTTLTVDGHIITGGAAPGVAAGGAADCGGAASVSIAGDDTTGTVTVTTPAAGTCAAGALAAVTFAAAYGSAPHVTLTPDNAASQSLGAYNDASALSTAGFTIGTAGTPAVATTYEWTYLVVQ